jgi:hypothetical protein
MSDTHNQGLPDWLTALPTVDPLPKYPRTPEHIELELMVFESIFETVLERMVEGDAPKPIVDADPRGISFGRFMRWVKKDPKRWERYEEAQEIGTETVVEEMCAIADAADSLEDIQRSKLRVDTRKWIVQARNRKRYGDKQQLDVTSTTISISATLQRREERLNQMIEKIVEGERLPDAE